MWELLIWGVLFVVFLIAEIATVAYVSIWFAVASLVSFIAALCGGSITLQIILFVVIAALLLLATRPLVNRYLSGKKVSTNADSVIGMEGVVRQEVDNLRLGGRVYVNGLDWAAKSSDGTVIPAGDVIIVEKIEGVTLVVKQAVGH